MGQSIKLVLLAGMIGCVFCDAAVAQVKARSDSRTPRDRVERVLHAVAAAGRFEGDASPDVHDLIAVVEDGENPEVRSGHPRAGGDEIEGKPAVVAISKKLSDPDHATRSAAVDALVAIGDGSVAVLRKLLSSSTARTRAAATQALARLKRLDLADAAKFSMDSDPRVRAAAADGLRDHRNEAVPRLADMLFDPELAVAVEAARALKSNRADPPIAIWKLTEAVPREHLSSAAGDALAAYGVAAQRAVPAVVKAKQEDALKHIGPPSELDIPQVCESLARGDDQSRTLAAKCLAWLGPSGKSAAPALEAAAEQSMKEYGERKAHPNPRSRGRFGEFDNPVLWLMTANECAAAVWQVTRDMPRFLKFIERLANSANAAVTCSRSTSIRDISPDHCPLIEAMLRHSNPSVQFTALDVISSAGPSAAPLKRALVDLVQSPDPEIAEEAIGTLAAIGPSAGPEAEPVLLSRCREGKIPLRQFADAVGRLEIRSEATRAILERGLHDQDQWTTGSCASALCLTSTDPHRTARMIIAEVRNPEWGTRTAISALNDLKRADDVVIPFLVAQFHHNDHWTRSDAVNSVGTFGAKATEAISPLKKLLADPSPWIRLKAAKAIFQITNDDADLEKQFEAVFANDSPGDRSDALWTLAELDRSGGKLVRYAIAELRRPPPAFAKEAIKALRAVGTAEAVAILRETAESPDWELRSLATEALEHIQNPDGKGAP
jgi:HEAT repeat protein